MFRAGLSAVLACSLERCSKPTFPRHCLVGFGHYKQKVEAVNGKLRFLLLCLGRTIVYHLVFVPLSLSSQDGLEPPYNLLLLKQSRQISMDKKISIIELFHASTYSTEVVYSMKGFYGICWDDQPNEIGFGVRQI